MRYFETIEVFPNSDPLADLGGVPGARPPKGPNSFVLTHKIFET